MLKKVLKASSLFMFLILFGVTFSLNELIKFQLNESSNIFLINLSEKGLGNLNVSQYKAYLNSTTLLNNLTYFYDEQNNLYLWFNNSLVSPFQVFYLAKEGTTNLQTAHYEINITNPNAYDLTNYQVRINISGITFNNFKVLDSNGNPVPYCFEQPNGECNTNPTSVIWVKVPFIPASGTTTLKVYQDSVNNAVNGDLVFDFYDDFNDGVLDSNKWVSGGTGTVALSNGYVELSADSYIYALYNLPSKVILRAGGMVWYGPGAYAGLGIFSAYTNSIPYLLNNGYGFSYYEYPTYDTADSSLSRVYQPMSGHPSWVEMKYDGSTVYFNNSLNDVWSRVLNIDITSSKIKIANNNNNLYKVSWIYIRKYADQEPIYTIQEVTTIQLDQFLPYLKDYNFTEYKLYLNSVTTNYPLPNYFNFQNLTFIFNTIEQNLIADKIVSISGIEYSQTTFDLSTFAESNYTVNYGKVTATIDGFQLSDIFNINNWFVVDRTPPQVSITHSIPSVDSILSSLPTYTFNIQVYDKYLDYCSGQVNKNDIILAYINENTNSYTGTLDIGVNEYSASLTCYDKAGNVNSASDSFTSDISKIVTLFSLTNPKFFNETWQVDFINQEFLKIKYHFLKNDQYLMAYDLVDKTNNILYSPQRAIIYLIKDQAAEYYLYYDIISGASTQYPFISKEFLIDRPLMKIPIPLLTNDVLNGNISLDTLATVEIRVIDPTAEPIVRVTDILDPDVVYYNKNPISGTLLSDKFFLPLGFYNLYYRDLSKDNSYSETKLVDSDFVIWEVPSQFSGLIPDYKPLFENNLVSVTCDFKDINKTTTTSGVYYTVNIFCEIKSLTSLNITEVNVSLRDNRGLTLINIHEPSLSTKSYPISINVTYNIPFYSIELEGYISLENNQKVYLSSYKGKFEPSLLPESIRLGILLTVVLMLGAVMTYYMASTGFLLAMLLVIIYASVTDLHSIYIALASFVLIMVLILRLKKPET